MSACLAHQAVLQLSLPLGSICYSLNPALTFFKLASTEHHPFSTLLLPFSLFLPSVFVNTCHKDRRSCLVQELSKCFKQPQRAAIMWLIAAVLAAALACAHGALTEANFTASSAPVYPDSSR